MRQHQPLPCSASRLSGAVAKDWHCLHIGYGKGEVFLLDSPCQDASSERADLGAGNFGGCEGGLNDHGLGRATKPNHHDVLGDGKPLLFEGHHEADDKEGVCADKY